MGLSASFFSPRRLLIGGIVLFGGAIFFLKWFSVPRVMVAQPHRGPAVQAVYATGTVEPEVMLPIAPRVGARLVTLHVDEGATVQKDTPLAALESDELRNAMHAAEVRERYARAEMERNDALLARKAISDQAFEQAKTQWAVARSEVGQLQAQLGYLELRAPATGEIIRRDGEVGQMIPANQPLFWMAVASPLRISAEIDEEDISLIKVGQTVAVRADAFPGQVFKASVKSITPKGDPISRSYRVRVAFSEATPLRIGMTTEVNVVVREHPDALLVPRSALLNKRVFVVENGVLAEREVVIGAAGLDDVEIVDGLNPEAQVVTNPNSTLRSGMKVRS